MARYFVVGHGTDEGSTFVPAGAAFCCTPRLDTTWNSRLA